MHTSNYDEIITFPVGDAKYPPDEAQQKVIKAINNTVVSAGAGSGKTEVLANRFTYLLMTDPDLHVRNILAITFTKKAAAEIYARVFKKLNDYKNTLSEERFGGKYIGENKPVDLAKRALDEFSDARIQTLDSYSNDVVKLAVARYGIKPDFSVGEPSSDINFMARNFVLRYINNEDFADAYKTYSQVGKFEQFSKDYFATPVLNYTSIATEKNWFSKKLEVQTKEILEAWNELFTDDGTDNPNPKECHFLIKELYNQFKDTKIKDAENKDYSTLEFSPYFKSCLEAINAGDEVDFSNLIISENEFAALDSLLKKLNPFINWITLINKISGNGSKKELKDTVKILKEGNDDPFNFYDNVTSCYSFIKNYNATKQLFNLIDLFLEEVNTKKKHDGILSFKDISELALLVLREQDDIREQQRSLIKKIMIDEFQDNNDNNRKLLFLISGKDSNTTAEECEDGNHLDETKLFFVGDEKQSIYKFRGADVSVFNGLKNSLKGFEGDQVLYEMNNNYRSNPELLKAFNEMFGDDKTKEPTQIPRDSTNEFYDIPSLFYFDKNDYAVDPETGKSKIPEYEAMYLKEFGEGKSNYATKPYKDEETGIFIADGVEPINLAEKKDGKYKNIKIHACILNSGSNTTPKSTNDGSGTGTQLEEKFSDKKKENIVLKETETAAYFIAKKIKHLIEESEKQAEADKDKKKKKLHYRDFAILDSSRTHRGDLQKFLTMENIPFSVDVQKNIFAEGIVNDFYNFLRICIYPNDTNAFTAFLTSPFVCMSQTGAQNVMSVIFDKSAKETDEDGNEVIKNFEAFSDEFSTEDFSLTETDKTKYENAKEFYKSERLKILSSSITKTVEHLWYNTGYFYETKLNNNTKIYGEQFDLLYQIAIQAENQGKNIEWFVDQLAITKETENSFNPTDDADLETDDVHYPLEKQDAVTIMTIHQSKGLEFDRVFVTGIFDNPKAEKSEKIYFDEETGVSVKEPTPGSSNHFFLRIKKDKTKKSLAEQKRLIYVAITRAKNEVYLVGDLAESESLKLKKDKKTGQEYYKAGANPPIMHKLLRYYYSVEKGLYQNNDYSDTALEELKIEEEPFYSEAYKAPFDFIKINPVSSKARTATQKSVREQRDELREKYIKLFEDDSKIVDRMEKPLQKTSSPSALEELEHQAISETSPLAKQIEEINSKGANPAYAELNSFFKTPQIAQTDNEPDTPQDAFPNEQIDLQSEEIELEPAASKSEFTRGTFGTMAHSYLEHWVKTGSTENVENPATFDSEVSKSLDENFDETEHQKLSEICKTMAENFSKSEIGKLVMTAKANGKIYKAENNFKMMLGDTLFNGAIDLFFENEDGTFTLVDYKTDEYIHPEKYFEQQLCYKNAIEKIYGITVSKCYLYFLRFDAAIEITEEVANTKL